MSAFVDRDGTTRLAGDILIGGTAGEVATVQADGTLAPAAGGGGAIELLGPFPVTYQTPNIANPGDNGALVGPALAANTFVLSAWIDTTTPWTAAVSVDGANITLDTAGSTLLELTTGTALNAASYQVSGGSGFYKPVWIQTGTERIAIAVFSTGGFTAGAGDVYALICAL